MSAPVITQQPTSQSASAGTNVTFTAAATGATLATLYKSVSGGGVAYGANTPNGSGVVSVTIPNGSEPALSSDDTGSYFFVFRNDNDSPASSTQSNTVTLTVTTTGGGTGGGTTGSTPPTITQQPGNLNVNVNGTALFSVRATTSTGTLTYQLYFSSTSTGTFAAISGATDENYQISPVQNSDSGYYYFIVGNGTGSTAQSQTVSLTVRTETGGSGPGGSGSGGAIGSNGTLTFAPSPLFSFYTAGAPNGLNVNLSSTGIAGRLILQDGAQFSKDEYNMDQASIPYKIFVGSDWASLLPTRGAVLSGFSGMRVWDPIRTITVGKVWVEFRALARGLIAPNGVSDAWNGFALNPPSVDAVGLASVQVSGTDGSSTATITFTRPQTTYRYVTSSATSTPPAVVNNGRTPTIIGYSIHYDNGSDTVYDGTNPISTGFNYGTRQRVQSVTTVQVGAYYQNEAVVVYEYYDTAGGS